LARTFPELLGHHRNGEQLGAIHRFFGGVGGSRSARTGIGRARQGVGLDRQLRAVAGGSNHGWREVQQTGLGSLVVDELAFPIVAVGPTIAAHAGLLALLPVARIDVAVLPAIHTLALRFPLREIAFVTVPGSVTLDALALGQAVADRPFVTIAIGECQAAFAFRLVGAPVPVVALPGGPGNLAATLLDARPKLSRVAAAILLRVDTLHVGDALVELPLI